MKTLQERMAEVFPEPREWGLQARIAALCDTRAPSVSAWFNQPDKVTSISRANAETLCAHFGLRVSPAWLAEGLPPKMASEGSIVAQSTRIGAGDKSDLVIVQYDTGGSMGDGFALSDSPPGQIKSWRVDHDWLRLNVPVHTGVKNLCIVTGFGPSMRPMFNPGDPLLVDRGVNMVDHEGVYFFRVGNEGFIKMVQRVPDPLNGGVMLQIISKNPDYPPYPMSPKNPHFAVLGKVLTVWRSEQY